VPPSSGFETMGIHSIVTQLTTRENVVEFCRRKGCKFYNLRYGECFAKYGGGGGGVFVVLNFFLNNIF
jgi:hypothetical protein